MKKSLLLVVLVLFMGACSAEPEPIVKEPTIWYYKEMKLIERNDFETSLEGRWIRHGKTGEGPNYITIREYTWTAEKGKKVKTIVIDEGITNSISEMSYELKYDAKNPNQALLVMHAIDEGEDDIAWNKFLIYVEIERQISSDFNTYNEYPRYYKPLEDIIKGPIALKRGSKVSEWNRI